MGTSDVMEVDASHLTFLTDLCVEFVDPMRVGTRSPKMAAPRFLTGAAASTFALRKEGAEERGEINQRHVPVCVAAHLFMCVGACGAGGVATLINSPISFHSELLPSLSGFGR